MNDKQSADSLAKHFAEISQTFEPLDVHKLPEQVKNAIINSKDEVKPTIREFQVYSKLKKTKKPKSSVPGDIP